MPISISKISRSRFGAFVAGNRHPSTQALARIKGFLPFQ